MTERRIVSGLASVFLVATILGTCSDPAAGQTRRRAAAPPPLNPDLSPEARQALEKQVQQQLDERTKRKTAAFREAETLKRRYAAEVDQDVARTSDPPDPESANERDGDTRTARPESERIGNPSYDVHAEPAAMLFHAGLLYLNAERWPAAKNAFQTIVEKHPESVWSQEARLCLCEMSIEVALDPAGGAAVLAPAVEWANAVSPGGPIAGPQIVTLIDASGLTGRSLPLQRAGPRYVAPPDKASAENRGGRETVESGDFAATQNRGEASNAAGELFFGARPVWVVAADVFLHAGLLAWLSDEQGVAREHFQRAFRLDAAPNSPITQIASAVTRGTAYTKTPDDALAGESGDIGRLIAYGDLIHSGLEMYRAHRLWDALLTRRSRELSSLQRGYVLFRRGHARYQFRNRLERDPEAILKDYDQSLRAAPRASWCGEVLMSAGNTAVMLARDDQRAIGYWQRLVDDHREHRLAPRAAYYIGVAHERAERWGEAKAAFERARDQFADESHLPLIEKHLRNVDAAFAQPSGSAAGQTGSDREAPTPVRRRRQQSP